MEILIRITQKLALGGLTDGVYNYELCSAYAAIANNGVYNKPTLYTKVLDHDAMFFLTELARVTRQSKTVQPDFLRVLFKP